MDRTDILQGVTALIHCCEAVGLVNAKLVLKQKLESLGAKVCQRLSKDTTHVVFQKGSHHDPEHNRQAEAWVLLELHDKASKVAGNVMFVSPLWVECCATEQRRAIERRFEVRPPPRSAVLGLSGSTPGTGSGKKARAKRVLHPTPAEAFEVPIDDAMFSSSQQIRVMNSAGPLHQEANSPAPAGLKSRTRSGSAARHIPTAADQDFAGVDASTQLAANILISDLATGAPAHSGSKRAVRAAARHKAPHEQPTMTKRARRTAPAESPAGMSHLRSEMQSMELASPPPRAGTTRRRSLRRRSTDQTDSNSAMTTEAVEAVPDSEEEKEPSADPSADPRTGTNATVALASKEAVMQLVGGAVLNGVRYSKRQMSKPQETELRIVTDQDLVPAPAIADPKCSAPEALDVPGFSQITSPWSRSDSGLVSTPGGTAIKTTHRQTRSAACAVTAAPLQSLTVAQKKGTARASRFATPSSITPAAGAPEASEQRPVPSEWSAPRIWDAARPDMGKQATTRRAGGHENADPNAPAPMQLDDNWKVDSAGPTQGTIALSSASEAITAATRRAAKQLRGLRLCADGSEEHVTHLVMGAERRTMKVLLAIANGAWLLTPEWVTASVDAGMWLPETPYESQSRFAAAAARARSARGQVKGRGKHCGWRLLRDERVHIHEPTRKGSNGNAPHLRRLAAALDAKVGSLQTCTLCVVAGGAPKPSSLPAGARAVTEEWLLHAAEQYSIPSAADSSQMVLS
ncbi:hypothetical protein WJX73_004071 [Symbiochloris irregularis]|uniref:BRCT domain-containing protein n=1 Tax=Symbiochloris irregularis TaxID=706552 RepID=A0AAW1PPP6_9CHLO